MSSIKGLDQLLRDLDKKSLAIQQEVKEIVELNVGDLSEAAFRDAPGGGDRIATQFGSIGYEQVSSKRRGQTPIAQAIGYTISSDGYSGSVYVDKSAGDIAAYVEFGTGQSASTYLQGKDPEWVALARRYYVNGKGTIVAKPYLYNNYLKQRIQFVNDLKEALTRLSK